MPNKSNGEFCMSMQDKRLQESFNLAVIECRLYMTVSQHCHRQLQTCLEGSVIWAMSDSSTNSYLLVLLLDKGQTQKPWGAKGRQLSQLELIVFAP